MNWWRSLKAGLAEVLRLERAEWKAIAKTKARHLEHQRYLAQPTIAHRRMMFVRHFLSDVHGGERVVRIRLIKSNLREDSYALELHLDRRN